MTGDWQKVGGTVQAGLVLAPMDINIEHIFELQEVNQKLGVQTPFGIKDKIQLIWKEVGKEKDYHRVWVEFNQSFAEKSGLVGFIGRASVKPILPGMPITLGDYLYIGMQIKVLVQARIYKKTGMPNGYYDFIPASIKPVGGQTTMPAAMGSGGSTSTKPPATLANVLFLAKGATNSTEAYFKIVEAKAGVEAVQEFLVADKAGLVKYPI